MRKTEREDLAEAMDHILALLDRVDRTTEQMQTVLMIREPNSTAAAEAYEGLRKQVIATSTERRQHLVQLAEFETALRNGADGSVLQSLVDGWIDQAGLVRVHKASGDEVDLLFELTEDSGPELKVSAPAYVDSKSRSVVKMGRARKVAPGAASRARPATNHTEPAAPAAPAAQEGAAS